MRSSDAWRRATQPKTGRQEAVVDVIEPLDASTFLFTLKSASGEALAPFRAGSSIPVIVNLAAGPVERLYPISSSPREAAVGVYQLVVRRAAGGCPSTHIIENWSVGSAVVLGVPRETGVCRHLRDGDEAVALVGGVGIVPFHSLAKALVEGDGDYHLTVLYAMDELDEMLYHDEWPQLEAQSGGRLHMVPVVTNATAGYETGPITRELISRYADLERATIFVCAPGHTAMAIRKELSPLKLTGKRLRFSFSGDSPFGTRDARDAIHWLTIRMGGETYRIPAREDETILTACEKAGLDPSADCRSSICGSCHATVVDGSFILATDETGERVMDRRHGYIHLCCSYPISDMELVVPRAKR